MEITGIVQGVGFRPFVCRAASECGVSGSVKNAGGMVIVDAQGCRENIKNFLEALELKAPAVAVIRGMRVREETPVAQDGFHIRQSMDYAAPGRFLPPDIAVCENCMQEVYDQNSPRYRYPFTSCTVCGPRYSILKRLPYDRKNSTMAKFEMCAGCKTEYARMQDRRFHAQTNCCPACGPTLRLLGRNGECLPVKDPISEAAKFLRQGAIIAVKGIGGYHLCCDAQSGAAVRLLRARKRRPDKPLAVMAKDMQSAMRVCEISEQEQTVLLSPVHPIVLLKKRVPALLPEGIAPGQNTLGLMLPYTPLHHLLLHDALPYLVMTSGNSSGLPLCYREEDAIGTLRDIADYFLVHDREIHMPVDDSVARVLSGREMVSRCGRGYAPVALPCGAGRSVIALGAQQKASVTLAQNGFATLSQYIGDLETYEAYQTYDRTLRHLRSLLNVGSEIYAHDLHPGYISTQYALRQTGRHIAVQHHHAHMAGCMLEHGLHRKAIGVVLDGTGLGTDGAVWGCEFFTGTMEEFQREGHLQYVLLQGGDMLAKEPWRCAACYLLALGIAPEGILPGIEAGEMKAVETAIRQGVNCCRSSSIGRLFDAVAAMLAICLRNTYDAQAAMELEAAACEGVAERYDFCIDEQQGELIVEYGELLRGILRDRNACVHVGVISAKFHNTIAAAAAACVRRIGLKTGLRDVVVSGGAFENRYLLKSLLTRLETMGFHTWHNQRIPINDGGISFGQAAVAAAVLEGEEYVPCGSGDGNGDRPAACVGRDHGVSL